MTASFPALEPAVRTWTMGAQPMQSFVTLSGHETRVLLGYNQVNTVLSLEFTNLKEDAALEIVAHYRGALGTFNSFAVPSAVFAGMARASEVLPAGQAWRYAAPPSIQWVSPGVATVSVELTAVLE